MKKFLITSIGRTGTKSVQKYLDAIPGVLCFHHKVGRKDVPFLFLSQIEEYSNITSAYLEERTKEAETCKEEYYIEVNPYLRFADPKVLKQLGWEKLFLVRHPKTYLESVFIRELFSEYDNSLHQMPSNEDPFSEKWTEATRFQKLCWYYAYTHEYIEKSGNKYYRYEDVVKKKQVLEDFLDHIGISKKASENTPLPKLNTTGTYKMRRSMRALLDGKWPDITPLDWSKLSEEELGTYRELCLPIAEKLGYVL